jgi:riboflavin kinase/FMN adenylyltransferase
MLFFHGVVAIPERFGPSAVTIGKFDGLHAGHRAILDRLVRRAADDGLVSVAVTFDRHPLSVIAPQRAPLPLVSADQKAELLAGSGVDAVLMLEFSGDLARLSPEDFVRQVLVDALHARVVFTGSDFRFGDRGAGDLAALREFGEKYGFEVECQDDVTLDGARVSSTAVRELVGEGRVREATRLLGRYHAIRSRVVGGERRGRELGYPTANLDPAIEGMLPLDGVYAAWGIVDGERYGAAVSIGNNPTFDGIPQHQVEAHLLDQKIDLYGRTLELQFVERIRAMNKFVSVEQLVAQLHEDEQRIREVLAGEPAQNP